MKYCSLFLFLLIIGCSSKPNNGNGTKDTARTVSHDSTQLNTAEVAPENSSEAKDTVANKASDTVRVSAPTSYIYENDTLKQVLKLKYITDHKIDFELQSLNKRLKKTAIVNGIGVLGAGSEGAESDTDEEGDAYSASEFVHHNKDCYLYIRIESDAGKYVQIQGGDKCAEANKSCPFQTAGLMKPAK